MPRHRRRRRGGERARYPHPYHRRVVDPPRTTTLRLRQRQPFERFWVPGFLDYQYLSLLTSLVLFPCLLDYRYFPLLSPPLTTIIRSPPFPLASPFILLSIFSCVVRAPRASTFFFLYRRLSMNDTVLTRSVERPYYVGVLSSVSLKP